jgi:hypothetical protein
MVAVRKQDLPGRPQLFEPVILRRRERIEEYVRAGEEVRADVDPDPRVPRLPVPDAGGDFFDWLYG